MDLKSPLVVSLEITSSCNLNCLYCYADPICGGHMHKLVFFDLIDSLLKQGVFKIHLSGGEPFLHPDIFEILKFSDDRQIDPALSTNGVVLNKQMIEKYSQVFTNAALRRIQISLDSHIEKIHNLTRGFFKEIMHNIELLIENKIDITIGIVVHKQNLPNISDMINYFYPDIKSYHLMNVMPCKRVIDNADFLVVSRKELDSFYRQLHLEVKNKYPGIILNSPFSEFDCIEAEESIECERCFAGYTRIAITPDLKVLPCPISRNVIMGDLNCNNLTDIWKSDVAKNIRLNKTCPCSPNFESSFVQKEAKDIHIN